MERIDRRVPIKVIAGELGVSETRINQHIRALKDIYEAENLGDLVEKHRAAEGIEIADGNVDPIENPDPSGQPQQGYSEPTYSKSQVPVGGLIGNNPGSNDPGELVMSDALPLADQAPWLRPGEPRVVPRVLDGEHAIWFRLAAIVGIAFGFLAAIVLTVTAAVTISEALDGRATVPVNEEGFS
ncbi:hypothetical protein [uncultured Erythrobacter sp.]|uniref:hypothetical protein n=1 Tax=uncultured Erythrobacter sp. TaxID=263913 RepID=UPI00262D267A|nr:hypothetical protein [uncultured Erythrobacter sp.]